ncbi:branched-chain-amino-acid aminotransferase [Microbacterium faecale]|uniref:branched-chain-amino-acid transaminase n=1 Tax=Microbacterium faecale TaxID=1804630 RepID=A0A916YB11_9MICO|nr:branched-chain amino acid aminotransferase [Microbacterium faecale]GGD36942.1 branched-chain-amino-acid aminotransferase [Microbacterium faecale]HJB64211.1 branched-chain amino acid aminotransferase [Candidatus Microbacterium pullistercoris]
MDITAPAEDSAPLQFLVRRNLAAKSAAERETLLENPGFGSVFTDHMVNLCWSEKGGWHRPRVEPYGPISLDPAAAVLHYAQEVFEGLKAYRHADGGIYTFRPEQNARRFNRSARRLSMPELPEEIFLQALSELIAADGDWVPSGADQTLYLRPFMFAKEAFLGVRPAKKYDFYVIGSPAGAYFTGGVTPVKIWLSENYARAAQGGTGAAKTGGNYASSLLPQAEAAEQGCDQVVFLDSRGNVEELGGMNVVFVKKDGTLVTPDSGSILDGVTRNSLLQLAEDRGHRVERRAVPFTEWREGVASGDIVEVFACGTAAVVTPIGELKAEGFVDEQPSGSLAHSLREELTDIQYGRAADRHGWLTKLG